MGVGYMDPSLAKPKVLHNPPPAFARDSHALGVLRLRSGFRPHRSRLGPGGAVEGAVRQPYFSRGWAARHGGAGSRWRRMLAAAIEPSSLGRRPECAAAAWAAGESTRRTCSAAHP